jgi:hypothetical protein
MNEPQEDIDYDCNRSFLQAEDKYRVLQLIDSVVSGRNKGLLASTLDKSISDIEKLLSPFQEQPQLLSPHVLDFINPLCDKMLKISESFSTNKIMVIILPIIIIIKT